MKEKPKVRSFANDTLPHDIAVALAGAAASEVTKTAIQGVKNKLAAKKKADSEKPTIILTDK